MKPPTDVLSSETYAWNGGGTKAAGAADSGGHTKRQATHHVWTASELECMRRTAVTRKLWDMSYPRLAAHGLIKALLQQEMPLVSCT